MTGVPDPSDRDRVTAILTLAEAATQGLQAYVKAGRRNGTAHPGGAGTFYAVLGCESAPDLTVMVDGQDKHEVTADVAFIVEASNAFPELARRLLEALDTIDIAGSLHHAATPDHAICVTCGTRWPCPTWQALNGGNE